jgi:hypothetical protein
VDLGRYSRLDQKHVKKNEDSNPIKESGEIQLCVSPFLFEFDNFFINPRQ